MQAETGTHLLPPYFCTIVLRVPLTPTLLVRKHLFTASSQFFHRIAQFCPKRALNDPISFNSQGVFWLSEKKSEKLHPSQGQHSLFSFRAWFLTWLKFVAWANKSARNGGPFCCQRSTNRTKIDKRRLRDDKKKKFPSVTEQTWFAIKSLVRYLNNWNSRSFATIVNQYKRFI